MKLYKKTVFSVVLVLLLCMTLAIPVSAAKPMKSDCGLLMITTSGTDIQYCMAVCVAEEDGNYVYSGNHPIQQQVALYASSTNALEYNNIYAVEEDSEYDEVQGVYRFALKEKVQSGSEADVYPEMAAVKKNDVVYFVHLNMDENDVFVMEKTTVKSVSGGILTTNDSLEKDSVSGDFSVIFNDSGDVVGFCKSGVATAPASANSGSNHLIWIVVLVAVGCIIGLLWKKQKKKKTDPMSASDDIQLDNDSTILESDTLQDEYDDYSAPYKPLVLYCHGGYLNGRVYTIPPEGITIGREPDNSIRYPSQTPGISRHHIKLFWQHNRLMLVDLGSSNGTYLNQSGRIAVMQPVSLNAGDVFYLGEKLNRFEITYKREKQ